MQLREVKSKSFNCEKDLQSGNIQPESKKSPSTTLKSSNPTSTTNSNKKKPPIAPPPTKMASSSTSSTSSPSSSSASSNHFSLNHIKLNYIDDEDVNSQATDLNRNNDKASMTSMTAVATTTTTTTTTTGISIGGEDCDDDDEDDDYDDNVIYEGDSDEINDEYLSHDEERVSFLFCLLLLFLEYNYVIMIENNYLLKNRFYNVEINKVYNY